MSSTSESSDDDDMEGNDAVAVEVEKDKEKENPSSDDEGDFKVGVAKVNENLVSGDTTDDDGNADEAFFTIRKQKSSNKTRKRKRGG